MKRNTHITPILAIGLFLCSAGALGGVVYATQQSGELLREIVVEAKEARAEAEALRSLERMVPNTKTDRAALRQLIVTGDSETVELLQTIEARAEASQVAFAIEELTAIEPEDAPFATLQIELALEGLPQSVHHFLAQLELLPYHSGIADVALRYERNPETNVRVAVAEVVLLVTAQDI